MSELDDDQRELAMEEWRLLQGAIANAERIFLMRQGWFFAIISGLVVGAAKYDTPILLTSTYLWLSLLVTVIFYLLELSQRLPHYRAIELSKIVETCLRDNSGYGGPIMSQSLGSGDWTECLEYCFKPRVCGPYIGAIILTVVVWMYLS